jgi:hypothetical protein
MAMSQAGEIATPRWEESRIRDPSAAGCFRIVICDGVEAIDIGGTAGIISNRAGLGIDIA